MTLIAGCGGDDSATSGDGGGGARYPEVVRVEAERAGEGTFDFSVTISSPYDSPERYADGWRVMTAEGEVLGEMTVGHDHATEQPFTRDQSGVEVPPGVERVVVEGHDLENGYGGKTASVELP